MNIQVDSSERDDVELLSFQLGEQEYCLDITFVREIRGWSEATPLPFSPPHIEGVINLRGTVLPVFDLSIRLGINGPTKAARRVIVVVQYENIHAGLLVDSVSDILTVPRAGLRPPPPVSDSLTDSCIRSLTLLDDNLVRILDLPAILSINDGIREAQ